jgi:hypothetical protein
MQCEYTIKGMLQFGETPSLSHAGPSRVKREGASCLKSTRVGTGFELILGKKTGNFGGQFMAVYHIVVYGYNRRQKRISLESSTEIYAVV